VQTLVDYSLGTATRSTDSNLLDSFTYERSYRTVVISRSNVQKFELLYSYAPPAKVESVDLDKFAQLGVNIFYAFVLTTITTFAPIGSQLAAFFIGLIGSFFSIALEDLYQFAIAYAFSIDATDYCPKVSVWVYKWTLRYCAAIYDRIGYVPLLVMYEVYVY